MNVRFCSEFSLDNFKHIESRDSVVFKNNRLFKLRLSIKDLYIS